MLRYLWTWILFNWAGLHRYFGIQNNIPREFERAAHYFSRVLDVDPTFHNARLQRGILLSRELGRHDEARADFDALLGLDAEWPEALLNRRDHLPGTGPVWRRIDRSGNIPRITTTARKLP